MKLSKKACKTCLQEFELSSDNFFRKSSARDGFSSRCKKCDYKRKVQWSQENPDRLKVHSKTQYKKRKEQNPKFQAEYKSKIHRDLKIKVFNAYGNKCECCGEGTFEFLSIDHTFGNGSEHRKKYNKSSFTQIHILRDIINENFPNTYQLLCFNCHFAKDRYGQCPHGLKREY